MKLRIYRTFLWEIAVPLSEVRFGGENPMRLAKEDRLQFLDDDGQWKDVEVIEEPKPPHPADVRREAEMDRIVNAILGLTTKE